MISDVVMPGMGGLALVRAVRELRPGLPAILASGYAQEAVSSDLAAEAIAFLPKPYTLKAMVAAVEARAR
jgi:DNA-binding NtrC family response regulator